jgi:hypothetical protein
MIVLFETLYRNAFQILVNSTFLRLSFFLRCCFNHAVKWLKNILTGVESTYMFVSVYYRPISKLFIDILHCCTFVFVYKELNYFICLFFSFFFAFKS